MIIPEAQKRKILTKCNLLCLHEDYLLSWDASHPPNLQTSACNSQFLELKTIRKIDRTLTYSRDVTIYEDSSR